MSESYEVGTKAWQPDSTEGWVPSEVEQKIVDGDKVRLVFRLDNGEVCLTVSILQLPLLDGLGVAPFARCRVSAATTSSSLRHFPVGMRNVLDKRDSETALPHRPDPSCLILDPC